MPKTLDSIAAVQAFVGQPAVVSDPVLVDQAMIDNFAEVTTDRQWIHVDVARAAAESPYGGTIAHGLLILALIPAWYLNSFSFVNRKSALNYGFDKIRFLAPVPSGSELRGSFQLSRADVVKGEEIRCYFQIEVKIVGSEKLAMVANWITQLRF